MFPGLSRPRQSIHDALPDVAANHRDQRSNVLPGFTGISAALMDPTRRQILQDLKYGKPAAGVIAAKFPISGRSVARHLSAGAFLSTVYPRQIVPRSTRRRKASSKHASSPHAGTARTEATA